MEIIFHNLSELLEFMEFAGYVPRSAVTDALVNALVEHAPVREPLVPHTQEEIDAANLAARQQSDIQGEPETAKRKRRTKAEIEADKRAAEEAATQSVQAGPQSAPSAPAEHKAKPNPFAVDAANMVANIQTMMGGEVIAPSALAAAAHAEPSAAEATHTAHALIADPAVWISQRAAEIGTVKQGEHLKICRNFISKFSLPKYNESFDLAGLTPNVMQYTPEQCALHQATLEFMSQPDASATTA